MPPKSSKRQRRDAALPEAKRTKGDSLQLWLENLQCGSLLSAFLEKEFSDLDTIAQHLTRDDVKKMGVEDARQEKIMSAVEELRRKTEMKRPSPRGAIGRAVRTVVGKKEEDLSFEEGDDLNSSNSSDRRKGRAKRKEGFFPPDAIGGRKSEQLEKPESGMEKPESGMERPESVSDTSDRRGQLLEAQPHSSVQRASRSGKSSRSFVDSRAGKRKKLLEEVCDDPQKITTESQQTSDLAGSLHRSHSLEKVCDSESEEEFYDAATSFPSGSNQPEREKSSNYGQQDVQKLEDDSSVSDKKKDGRVGQHSCNDGQSGQKPPIGGDADSATGDVVKDVVKSTPTSSSSTLEKEGLLIEFHVLIHPEWGFNPSKGHRVGISFGHSWLGNWNEPAVEMKAEEIGANKYWKLKGNLLLPPGLESKPIAYKYTVRMREAEPVFEFIKQATGKKSKAVVDRVLDVPKPLQERPKGVYRKYDDVIRKEPGFIDTVTERLIGSRYVENRTMAIEAMLPKWPGFGPRESLREMTAEDALCQVDLVIESLRHYRVWQNNRQTSEVWELKEFSNNVVAKAVQKHLNDQLALLASEKDRQKREETAIVFSLAVSLLVQKYKLDVNKDQVVGLLSAMALLPDTDNNTCSGYELVIAEFKNPRSHVDAVRDLCRLACRSNVAEWLLALPLCHFLEGVSGPFQAPATVHHNSSKWWGLEKIYDVVKVFREKQSNQKAAFDLLERLRPLFLVDPLSIRAFLFVISLEHLAGSDMVGRPFEIIHALDEKAENAKPTKSFLWGSSSAKDTAKWVLTVIQNILKRSSESTVDLHESIEEMHRNTKSAVMQSSRLLRTISGIYTTADNLSLIAKCRDLVFAMMNSFKQVSTLLSDEGKEAEDGKTAFVEQFSDQVRHCFASIEEWLARVTQRPKEVKSLLNGLKMWSDMAQSEFLTGELEIGWTDLVESKLKRNLQNVEPALVLTAASQLADAGLHHSVVTGYDCILDEVFDRLPAMGSKELENLVRELISGVKKESEDQARSAKTLCRVLERRCPSREAPPMDVLRHLLSWRVWEDLLQLIGTFPQLVSLLEPSVELIMRTKSTLKEIVDRLANGSITVEELNVVSHREMRNSFFKLCRQYDDLEKHSSLRHLAESSVGNRDQELCEYRRLKDLVNNFVAMFGSLGIGVSPDVDCLSTAAKRDVTKLPISDLCKRSESGEIIVQCLGVPRTLHPYLDELRQFSQSSNFLRLWRQHGNKMRENRSHAVEPVALDEIMTSLCRPVFDEWRNLCKSVRDGSIILHDVASVFSDIFRDRPVLVRELQVMDIGHVSSRKTGKKSWIEERATQIEMYGQLANTMDAAKALKRVCGVLEISQPMPEIESIIKQNSRDFRRQPITVLSENVLSASRFLSSVTEPQVGCLQAFASAKPLIAWLRNDIKEWKELETFVELAGARSSGEGDYEVMRVAHLHAACAGYAHLLFKVDQDAKFGNLRTACSKVFALLKRDPQLPRKWLDTEKNLEEFKFMRASLSSVETFSFAELELINSRGVYHVGCIQSNVALSREGITVDNSVKVEIVEDVEERTAVGKIYCLPDLKDLQSKLILISGHKHKSGSDVEFFVEALARVMRLANVFVNLSRAGHDKYLNWKKTFRCRTQSSAPLLEIFEQVEKTHDDSEFLQSLTREADNMEQSLGDWNNDVDHYRSLYYYLNYFTTPQLLALRRELGILVSNRSYRIPNDVFALLGLVNPSSNPSSVAAALSDTYELAASYSSRGSPRKLIASSQVNVVDIRQLHDMGFPKRRASTALQQSKGDLDMAVQLCLQYGESESDAYDTESFEGDEISASSQQGFQRSELDVEMVDKSSDDAFSAYLPLKALGRLLKCLAADSVPEPFRPFPTDHFKVGEANLLVVPRNEVLVSVVNLYMIDASLPLPTAQEVFLCTSSTSTEEVCLMWRRSIGDPGHRRLFSLAMADNLSYEVSRKAVDDFNRLVQRQRTSQSVPFKIAIVCAAENEDKSYIIGALEEFRRPSLPCPSAKTLQAFLKDKFCSSLQAISFTHDVTSPETAASLDHESSSVRVVRSHRAGVGKTFYINTLAEGLSNITNNSFSYTFGVKHTPLHIVVPLHDRRVNVDSIVKILRPFVPSPNRQRSRLIHIDVSPSVTEGLDIFLFNLLILGEVSDSCGYVWRRTLTDMYVVEVTSTEEPLPGRGRLSPATASRLKGRAKIPHASLVDCLPTIMLPAPVEVVTLSQEDAPEICMTMIDREFRKSEVQRAFQYLKRFAANENLDLFRFQEKIVEGDYRSCLQVLLKNCGVRNPSWGEIRRFVRFLSGQLLDCEKSSFCDPALYGEDLPGFKAFVLKLIIRMSRDFATPSIDIKRSGGDGNAPNLDQHKLRRQWENSSHPYLFFNEDRHSMTFVGVQINREGQLLDPQTGQVLDANMMSRDLSTALYTQGYRLQENYDDWDKPRKIQELCRVMGVEAAFDPDETYELTMDNVKKILAIQMRFRCGIPVVIMGETGCGKTRLIRYMCALQANCTGAKNMLLMKVHGGVTHEDIMKRIEEAEEQAETNRRDYSDFKIQTVLFFDEANTTDSLGLIKEIMCDKRAYGRKIRGLGKSLQVIAACNPYRKHTEQMIQRLEEAGLGYHVRADSTEDRLGEIPLRQLVYRVHALPDSMKALVWDFGQLDPNIEKLYIKQIVSRHVEKRKSLPNCPGLVDVLTDILAIAQHYMRGRSDECSFVSLRDVERAMLVTVWFYKLQDHLEPLIVNKHKCARLEALQPLDWLTSSVILGLAVCYYARLKDRKPFREVIAKQFQAPCVLPGGSERMNHEICHCQDVFLDELELPPQIARNHALSENVFMMLVCIDLRIPLFLVGKPGSSKSLAKDTVKTAMKGQLSHSDLLKGLKQLHMVSYQCSPLSTAEGIITAFQQCQSVQKENDKDHYVSCVVLDEVGLAEDSPRLPLKALHPLLDDGTAGADTAEEEEGRANRVAFVGLSNWALDPAKMNRGILVNREEPDDTELIVSAKGICSSDSRTLDMVMPYLEGMAKAYRIVYEEQKKAREFFGLRDFYSLVKMVFEFCKRSKCPPSLAEMEHAVRRNFGGQDAIDIMEIFHRCCSFGSASSDSRHSTTFPIDNTTVGLIRSSLVKGGDDYLGESRYMLLLTENYAALNIIRQRVILDEDPVIIFGSGFPKDQEYSHICRTINRIKVCMATGRTVVLLNLDRLYESLYDVLNQYYVRHGGEKFVDLGLGNHRVKCQVHADFRLIVIAEKDFVYQYFPIPLINRMEKHFLAMKSVLSPRQERVVEILKTWVTSFALVNPSDHVVERGNRRQRGFKEEDAFVGYHGDAVATVVLQTSREISERNEMDQNASSNQDEEWEQNVFDLSLGKLLSCATPDSLARVPVSGLSKDAGRLWEMYFSEQHHNSIADFMKFELENVSQREHCSGLLLQVTTHSRLLSSENVADVAPMASVESIALQQFDTEQQFCTRIRRFYECDGLETSVLIVQCEAGYVNNDMIASARYLVQQIREEALSLRSNKEIYGQRHLLIIVQVPRVAGGCFVGFQGGCWIEAHVDELRPDAYTNSPSVGDLLNCKLSSLLVAEGNREEPDSAVVVPSAPELAEFEPMDTGDLEEIEMAVPMEVQKSDHEHTVLNCNWLLRACIHAAVSRLDDHQESVGNASRRVHILLQLITNEEGGSARGSLIFFEELLRRVGLLLHERDERMEADSASMWVRKEALSHSSIQAGGTFRRALWLRIVNVITPVVAEIVALLDYNSNLRLMSAGGAEESEGNWLTVLWLDLFCCSQFGQLRYDDYMSPESETRQRVPVESSGFRGHTFEAQFPFSHLVKRQLDEMLQEARTIAESSHERLDIVLQRLFDNSEVGNIVCKALDHGGAEKNELVDRYLHDFLHMVYNAASKDEYEIVECAIVCGLNEMAAAHPSIDASTGKARPTVVSLSSIHATFEYVRRRLYSFGDMVRHRADIIRIIHSQISKDRKEMVIDAIAADVLRNGLSPDHAMSDPRSTRKWLNLIQRTKPLIESWLSVSDSSGESEGIRVAITSEIRLSWMVFSVLRLFVEHLQPLAKDRFIPAACLNLYKCLKSVDVDLTKEHSVRAVQRFLDKTNKEFVRKMLRGKGSSDQCSICLDPWRGRDPVSLPCHHVFCCSCIKAHFRRQRSCPICNRGMPENFLCRPDRQLNEAGEICCEFKRCCTAFFMELVSVYSFSEAARLPPAPELVHMLMELVVQRRLPGVEGLHTRPFSPFEEDTIDSRPVVRSFLLQLLLKYSTHQTLQYVERIFVEAQTFLHGSSTAEMDDLSVIFVQCMEDALHQRYRREDVSRRDRVCMVLEEFDTAPNRLQQSAKLMTQLQGIASIRFCLSVTSEVVSHILSLREDERSQVQDGRESFSSYLNANFHSARKVLSKAEEVCRAVGDPQLLLFLFKQLVQKYGMDTITKIRDHPALTWICPIQREETEPALPDFFVVIQSPYLEARDAVARTVSNKDTRHLEEVIKKRRQTSSDSMMMSILLALYREVTTNRAYRDLERQIQPQTLDLLEDYVNHSSHFPTWCSSLAADLLRNAQGRPSVHLQVLPGQSIQHRALSGLALHAFIVLSSPNGHRLLEPLRLILTEPQRMNNSYFPTMPEDFYMEARGLVQGTRWYECKNGHPYLVMNCGQPMIQLRCTDCGAPIGQSSGDKNARTHNTTQTGHVLGPARQRSDNPTPERDLSPSACTLLRLLLHAALLWASCSQDQNVVFGVAQCVSPAVGQDDLPAFFWSHFKLDAVLLSKAIGRNVEDTVVACHQFLSRLAANRGKRYGFSGNSRLTTPGERKAWEKGFLQKHLVPFLQSMQNDIYNWLQLVVEDRSLGNNPVMRQLYELDNPAGSRFSPQLWRYRVPVSIDHLMHTIDQNVSATQPHQFQLLKTFLKEESKLRALQYLPDVIKLQRLLVTKYHRRLSRQEALGMNVESFLSSVHEVKERQKFEKLILSFSNAWKIVKENVLNHGRLRPKKEHELHSITRQTPLAFLLPRPQDEGTCAVALVDYLINYTQNEFLETFRRIAGVEGDVERVPMEEVTKSQLIAYDVERDLMPLVYAHCDYSLAVGEGTKISYNLQALERQIVDRFLVGRPNIDMQVYRVAYRKDVYNVALFERTRQRVPQEPLSIPVQHQIVSELHDLTDVYGVLALLDIVIGFLSSSGGSSETLLDHYVHTTIGMPNESSLVSPKIQQFCQLKHVLALWRLLTVEKGRRLALADREPFDQVQVKYRQEMPRGLRSQLRKALRRMNVDTFLIELVEVITLELGQWEETNNIEDYPLGAALQELHGCQLVGLDEIPDEVQLKHITECFTVAVKLEAELTKPSL